MKGQSLDIKNDRLSRLKEIFPEVFAEDKVDWEKLKATLGEDIVFENERYVLNWAGKSDAFRVLQEPTTATLVPSKKESVNFDDTDHIFIEGENLEVLKVLQKSYYGKVKMIYIDPPYNTGNDSFIYPDRFSEKKNDYLKRVGDKDEQGYMTREGLFRKNNKESGHYHSNWLNMMYPRLFLARNLLRDDGVIFVSIDDNEVHNLRLIMNEIFGEENHVAILIWEGAIKNDSKFVSVSHDYIVTYAKNKDSLKINEGRWRLRKDGIEDIYTVVERLKNVYKDNYNAINIELRKWYGNLSKNHPAWSHRHYNKVDRKGVYFSGDISWPGGGGPKYEIIHPITHKPVRIPTSGWRYSKIESMKQAIKEDRIDFGEDESKVPTIKRYLHETEGQVLSSVLYKDRRAAMQRLRNLLDLNVFENPKDERVIAKLVEATTNDGDLIFDFFAGSGTTAHAVLDLNKEDDGNRKFICVQMPEKTEEGSEAYKAGYKTISDIAKERIRRVIDQINKEQEDKKDLITELEDKKPLDLGFKVFKLQPSNFKIWHGSKFENDEDLFEQLDAFTDPVKQGSQEENILFELLLKSGFDLNSKIEYKNSIFIVNKDEMVLALSKIDEPIINEIIALKPQKCLALDRLFQGNDQLKTNTVLQMKDAKIDFRTV